MDKYNIATSLSIGVYAVVDLHVLSVGLFLFYERRGAFERRNIKFKEALFNKAATRYSLNVQTPSLHQQR